MEAPYNSVMVLPEDDLAWSYGWVDGFNCIKFSRENDPTGLKNRWKIVEKCEEALKRNDLYEIYLNGKKTIDQYRIDNYVKYLEVKIAEI